MTDFLCVAKLYPESYVTWHPNSECMPQNLDGPILGGLRLAFPLTSWIVFGRTFDGYFIVYQIEAR